ncbi:MAG: DUF2294 domain-containing protein [Dehalococcoidia bacterium]|nr:DUF2294 domain-containing protein [Dehalococcoidia bacterium]
MLKGTKGQIEAEISRAIVKLEQDYFGRGPLEAKTRILDNSIIIHLKGVLTPAERQLAKDSDGVALIKGMRAQLFEGARTKLEEIIAEITGSRVLALHADISTRTGERLIAFTLDKDLEKIIGPQQRGSR